MTAQECYQYSFISLICLGLLIQNYVNVRQYGPKTTSGLFFRLFILAVTGISFIEIVYGLREAHLIGQDVVFAYTEEILYSLLTMLAGYLWYIASELHQESRTVATNKMRILVSIPMFIMIVVTLFTPIHHLNFYFEDGHYVRGPLVLAFSLIMCLFIVATGVSALVKSFRREFYLKRAYLRIIFLYAIILLFSQALQLVFGSVLPFRSIGAALVIYIIQQRYIKGNVYRDPLTGANNRNAAERFLTNHIGDDALLVAMIDIDSFKKINDTYGHNTGDKAIRVLAKAFMSNLSIGIFFGRYGGDEFLLMEPSDDREKLETVVRKAELMLQEMCLQENLGFSMSFSCGIIKKTADMTTIPDVLEAADEEMYRVKREKKAERV